MAISVPVLCAPLAMHLPVHVAYTRSDNVPLCWYLVAPVAGTNSLHVGDIFLAQPPADVAALAALVAKRRYLPEGVPILKCIGAIVGIRQKHVVHIDGDVVATTRPYDGRQRPLQAWAQCRALVGDELVVLSNTNPASFDSRVFRPFFASGALGIACSM